MPREEPPVDVEFLTGEPGADDRDEVLAEPSARSRRPLAIGATVLVGVALLGRALTDHSSAPTAAASSSARPSPSSITSLPAPFPLPPLDLSACPPAGDGQSSCRSARTVPAATLAAVRDRFPHARQVSALDETLRDTGLGAGGLWYRELRVRDGRRTLTILVHRHIRDDEQSGQVDDDGQQTIARVDRPLGALQVSIRFVAPSGDRTSFRAINSLAADRRLIALG